ncbi:MAG: peptidoglycan-binding protein, partial [Acidimicrobiia bacterium]|nr:peptidoglycan-binding protein [Acidimicrobiia bacterium]
MREQPVERVRAHDPHPADARRAARRPLVLGTLAVVLVAALVVAFVTGDADNQPAALDAAESSDGTPTGNAAPGRDTARHSSDPDRSDTTDDRENTSDTSGSSDASTTTSDAPRRTATTADRTAISVLRDDGTPSDEREMREAFTVSDDELTPKSVVASGKGLFFAQNMMYRHNVSVYDRGGDKVATISDRVDLAAFGVEDGVEADGSPVEAAFTPDGRYAYVSNYKMYGNGFNPVADDPCDAGDWDDSYVYRIDTKRLRIDKVIPTGAVPKYVAVTPDGSKLLVSNWCGFDVSVIDTAKNVEISRIPVGRHPRGIAVTSDSSTAYVTVMGESRIARIDLAALAVVGDVPDAGGTPRHLQLSGDDRFLYVSNNLEGVVRKIDLQIGAAVGTVATGVQPRSTVLTPDGTALFVVNYQDGTVSKVRTSDMTVR